MFTHLNNRHLNNTNLNNPPFPIMLLISHYVTHFSFALNRGIIGDDGRMVKVCTEAGSQGAWETTTWSSAEEDTPQTTL